MPSRTLTTLLCAALALAVLAPAAAQTGRFRRAFAAHRQAQTDPPMSALPAGVRVIRDLAYGNDAAERFDVYLPEQAVHDAPVIFLVHGGGWAFGDKDGSRVVQNKVAHWVPRGVIVVSTNYPMLPAANPLQQARHVAQALATAQRLASQWGGDRHQFVLMGHSAGAHLVSLLSAEPTLALEQGATPWLGTVALDSAAYDVAPIMQARHLPLYDRAFGSDTALWQAASPALQLHARIAPYLAVCSSQRRDSCPQAQGFVAKAKELGARAQVQPEDLSHEEINAQLGLDNDYTAAVDAFLRRLAPTLAARLP